MNHILKNTWPSLLFFCFPIVVVFGFIGMTTVFGIRNEWYFDLIRYAVLFCMAASIFTIPYLLSVRINKNKAKKPMRFALWFIAFFAAYGIYLAAIALFLIFTAV